MQKNHKKLWQKNNLIFAIKNKFIPLRPTPLGGTVAYLFVTNKQLFVSFNEQDL